MGLCKRYLNKTKLEVEMKTDDENNQHDIGTDFRHFNNLQSCLILSPKVFQNWFWVILYVKRNTGSRVLLFTLCSK